MEPLEASSGVAWGDASVTTVSPPVHGKFWSSSAKGDDEDGLEGSSSLSPSPEVYRRSSPVGVISPSSREAARASASMAARTPLPPRTGALPSNPPLRQPVPHRSTPVRSGGHGDDGAGAAGAANNLGPEGQGDQQSRPVQQVNRFEQGSNSGQGGRIGEWRDEGFNGQGFGGYDEGYFEGKGASGRFNGNNSRYQRVFNTNESNVVTDSVQAQDKGATQIVALAPGISHASLNLQNMETSLVESLSTRAQKKIDKMQCLRCGENGHLAETCTAVLCLYCEKTSHESINCPLHSLPKPVAISYGVSRNELIFHEIPASSDVTLRHDSGKVGKISVTDGILSPQEVVKELEWIIPGNHQWDLTPTDDGAFKAIFPSKADLARMTKIINVLVPGTSMYLPG
ncbi:hypothetical protein ACQ4PT_064981 [Festuca glaucescens]